MDGMFGGAENCLNGARVVNERHGVLLNARWVVRRVGQCVVRGREMLRNFTTFVPY